MMDIFPVGWKLADRGPGPNENEPVWAILADGTICMMASVLYEDGDGEGMVWAKVYDQPWWNGSAWQCEAEFDDNYDVRAWLPLPTPPTLAELAADPTPSPAVCAALAGYRGALAACDSAPEGEQGKAILDRYVAESRLQDALRDERAEVMA